MSDSASSAALLRMTKPKLCRTCRWSRPYWPLLLFSFGIDRQGYWRYARCMHPSARQDNTEDRRTELLVTGGTKLKVTEQRFCATQRQSLCGEEGRFWEGC
jgi:hypothetical protein